MCNWKFEKGDCNNSVENTNSKLIRNSIFHSQFYNFINIESIVILDLKFKSGYKYKSIKIENDLIIQINDMYKR